MFSKAYNRPLYNLLKTCHRSYSNESPFTKTWKRVSEDISNLIKKDKIVSHYPQHADIVIIGGGFIGSAAAYWLKTRAGEGLSVVVLEKDFTYQSLTKNASLGTVTQHFSLPENFYLSKYGAEFLRNAKKDLGVDIEYCPHGHLLLASEKYADKLEENITVQREFGLRNEILTPEEIKKRFPWINTTDIKLGSMTYESEGVFNAQTFLEGLIKKSKDMGTTYVNAEVTGFDMEEQRDVLMEGVAPGTFQRINKVKYRTADNEVHEVKFAVCVLAAGHESADVARLANIGSSDGLLSIPLPIQKREEIIYSIKDKGKHTGLNTPLITDTSGLWLRRNRLESNLLCGHVPLPNANISEEEFYSQMIRPSLLNRVPECENAEIQKLTTEIYDYNPYDDTGILGPHPYHNNLYIAAGFGKLGCQHAPGVGRAIAELVIDSMFVNIDLTRFGFDRLLMDEPLVEFNVY